MGAYARSQAPRIIVVTGATSSGKTTLARTIAEAHGFVHLSSDRIRLELTGDPLALDPHVFDIMHARCVDAFLDGRGVVLDSTGVSRAFARRVSEYRLQFAALHLHLVASPESQRLRESLRTDRWTRDRAGNRVAAPMSDAFTRISASATFAQKPDFTIDTDGRTPVGVFALATRSITEHFRLAFA
jgi:predicted kinase